MISRLLSGFVFLFSVQTFSQDSIKVLKPKIDISGYIDTYYTYDFSYNGNLKNQNFLYNYTRHNEFAINLALIKASINYENVYAKIALQAGSYVQDNYGNLNLFNEAYLGVYLDKNRNASIEVGILPSYIGFESATSHSNLTVTRSILAENSPYYMTGVKFNYQINEKLFFSTNISNGWQRIEKVYKKSLPSFGTQIQYKKSESELINWSTFIGDEPNKDFVFRTRYFSNFYWDKKWNSKWKTIVGFDIGAQKRLDNSKYAVWSSPVFIARYSLNNKWEMAYRSEYFKDKENVIVDPIGIIPQIYIPFETLGNSLNLDFLPNSKMKIRMEGKWYHASEFIFTDKKDDFSVTTTMSFEF